MAQFTQKAIMDSFMRFVEIRPLDKITVKDIVEDCEITRNTFYYHFQDIYDLTVQVFRAEFGRVLEQRCGADTWEERFVAAVRFATENKKAVLHIYNSAHRTELARSFEDAMEEFMAQLIDTLSEGIPSEEPDRRLIARIYSCAVSGFAKRWLEDGMKGRPDELIERMSYLFGDAIPMALRRSAQSDGESDIKP